MKKGWPLYLNDPLRVSGLQNQLFDHSGKFQCIVFILWKYQYIFQNLSLFFHCWLFFPLKDMSFFSFCKRKPKFIYTYYSILDAEAFHKWFPRFLTRTVTNKKINTHPPQKKKKSNKKTKKASKHPLTHPKKKRKCISKSVKLKKKSKQQRFQFKRIRLSTLVQLAVLICRFIYEKKKKKSYVRGNGHQYKINLLVFFLC
jgi:hypothetical protein